MRSERSPKISLASPKFMSNLSTFSTKGASSTHVSFTQMMLKLSAVKSEEDKSDYPNKIQVEDKLKNLNIKSFISSSNKISKTLQPIKPTGDDGSPEHIKEQDSNAYICLCGMVLINSASPLCDECLNKQMHGIMSGNLYQYDSKDNKFTENFCKLEGKEIMMFEQMSSEKPSSIFSLVDCYLFVQGYASLTYKGKSYFGFQLQSTKKMVIYYAEDQPQKEKWMCALNAVIKYQSINEFYDMKGMIGKGKYGVVREAIHKQTGKSVAIKGLVKSKMNEEDLEMIRREVDIMRSCQHSNIITLYDYFENDQYIFISTVVISS